MNARQQSVAPGNQRSQRGFSLFELIVYILVSSILFAAAFNRYQQFPGEAERANFTAVLAQLKAGVNLQMINMIAGGSWHRSGELDGSNPMDLMLETPTNYLGALGSVDEQNLPRRIWYFDSSAGELVYRAENTENLYAILGGELSPVDQLRFKVTSVYREGAQLPVGAEGPEGVDGGAVSMSVVPRGRWQGIVLEAVYPFEWRRVPLQLATQVEP